VPESQALQVRQVGAGGEVPPYSLQTTGDIKYAPMQQQPPTSITVANTEPMYPTTTYNIARSALQLPTFISTQTQPVTYQTSSIVNPVSIINPGSYSRLTRCLGDAGAGAAGRHGQIPSALERLIRLDQQGFIVTGVLAWH
jgi:Yeast cell wall synthesis protein KRE9/KNH1